jgi:hypothetical protein
MQPFSIISFLWRFAFAFLELIVLAGQSTLNEREPMVANIGCKVRITGKLVRLMLY